MIDEQEAVQYETHHEHYKVAMTVVPNTAGQPHAMVVKPSAAAITQFAVLGELRDHYLWHRCVCVCVRVCVCVCVRVCV